MIINNLHVITLSWILLRATLSALPFPSSDDETSGTVEALNAVLNASPQRDTFVILVSERKSLFGSVAMIDASLGIGLFEVTTEDRSLNVTRISQSVAQAQWVKQMYRSVTVVVVSDDPAFLTTFTEWSLKGRLLVWSTRLLVLTRLPLRRLHHLRNTLAITNSMLLILTNIQPVRGNLYVDMPYRATREPPLLVGSWTIHDGFTQTSLQMFPEKFEKLVNGPRLKVAYIEFSTTKKKVVDDPEAPGGKRVVILDAEVTIFEAIAKAMNFTFQPKIPVDGSWGIAKGDGSFTGMIGMLQRKEADLSLSTFQMTAERAGVVDFAFPLTIWYSRIIVHRGQPEVDPWGFLLPLTSLVWLAILTTLIGLILVMMSLQGCFYIKGLHHSNTVINAGNCIRVLLHQDVIETEGWWWWERVVMGVWMLMTLVLTQSYAGNLMSILAVRYIPLPIQSLQDIVDNPVTLLLPRGTNLAQQFLDADSGVLGTVGALQYKGRLQTILMPSVTSYLDTHVRKGTHVFVTIDLQAALLMAQDFTSRGRCDFYQAREELLPTIATFTSPKDSPLLQPFSLNMMRVVESGIYNYWLKIYTPNFTSCLYPPKKVALRTTLGINNVWGTLVVIVVGIGAALLVFCVELLLYRLPYPVTHLSH